MNKSQTMLCISSEEEYTLLIGSEVTMEVLSGLAPRARMLVLAALMLICPNAPVSAQILYWPLPGLDWGLQRAAGIHCVNNLYQIYLAARSWSFTNGGRFPSALQLFTNDLSAPSVLFCPADLVHQAPTNWEAMDWSQVDYQWIAQ